MGDILRWVVAVLRVIRDGAADLFESQKPENPSLSFQEKPRAGMRSFPVMASIYMIVRDLRRRMDSVVCSALILRKLLRLRFAQLA